MTRIDEACGVFTALNAVMEAQETIHRLLKEVSTTADAKMGGIISALETTYDAVKDDYQAYGVFVETIQQSKPFSEWVKKMPPATKYLFEKNLRTMIPAIDANHVLISKEDLGYKSNNYKAKSKSVWLTTQEKTPQEESRKTIARLTEEFIRQERVSISIAAQTPAVFFQFLQDPKVTVEDKSTINAYLGLLSEQRAAYDNLRLEELLNPPSKSLKSVLGKLCQQYLSRDYQKYQDVLEDMLPLVVKLENIVSKYPAHSTQQASVLLQQQQAMPKLYTIVLGKLEKVLDHEGLQMSDLQSAVIMAKKREASVDACYLFNQFIDSLGDVKKQHVDRQKAALNNLIFESELTLPTELYDQHRRGVYLEHMLVEAFPEQFEIVDRCIKVNDKRANAIYDALGGKPRSGATLNPHTFSPQNLRDLGQDPASVLLRAIKPVDKKFSLEDKVDAYKDLIQLAKNDQLKIGSGTALIQARAIADHVLQMVQQRFQQVAGEDTHTLADKMKAIYELIRNPPLMRVITGGVTEVELAYKAFNKGARTIAPVVVRPAVVKVPSEKTAFMMLDNEAGSVKVPSIHGSDSTHSLTNVDDHSESDPDEYAMILDEPSIRVNGEASQKSTKASFKESILNIKSVKEDAVSAKIIEELHDDIPSVETIIKTNETIIKTKKFDEDHSVEDKQASLIEDQVTPRIDEELTLYGFDATVTQHQKKAHPIVDEDLDEEPKVRMPAKVFSAIEGFEPNKLKKVTQEKLTLTPDLQLGEVVKQLHKGGLKLKRGQDRVLKPLATKPPTLKESLVEEINKGGLKLKRGQDRVLKPLATKLPTLKESLAEQMRIRRGAMKENENENDSDSDFSDDDSFKNSG